MPGPRKEEALVLLALSNEDLKTSLMPRLSVTALICLQVMQGTLAVGTVDQWVAPTSTAHSSWPELSSPSLPAHLHAVLL